MFGDSQQKSPSGEQQIAVDDGAYAETARIGAAASLCEDDVLSILGYLVSSAELCLDDPPLYGSFRLLDAANRFLGILLDKEPVRGDTFFRELKEQLDVKKDWLMYDQEGYRDFVRQVPMLLARYLRARAEAAKGTDGTDGY